MSNMADRGRHDSIGKLNIPVLQGEWALLSKKVRDFVETNITLCEPDSLWICDGSEEESNKLLKKLLDDGVIRQLPKYKNCYLSLTDPADVARVESKTVIVTKRREDAVPTPKEGVKGELGIWMSPAEYKKQAEDRWPGCMKGRTMFVIPYSMGPVGSTLSKIGIQVTDSVYVVLSMRVMTRMGTNVLETLGVGDFVRCLHSIGCPLPTTRKIVNGWACNPEKVLVAHFPDKYEIHSFGSAYGGNALLGKKCFALRIGCTIARDEGWLAEHMLITRLEMPNGKKKYITAAFPSQCGKTNMAMIQPSLPGYKATCIGDDIAWMRFDDKGVLHAINPEAGFFGVAPGTSMDSNPMAMGTIFENTIFTNVASTSDGGVWWEGLDLPPEGVTITDWHGNPWTPGCGKPAAHPNSRFASPASQCPIIDPDWEDPKGVPIDAIIFGGRRPEGVPLIYESFSWNHGVFVGATTRSETTAAQQDSVVKVIRNDPFAMKPFFGYNFGHYLRHWLHFGLNRKLKLPKIYHVNWFRKDPKTGKFLWPGFGENSRVLDWICRRLEGEECANVSPVGMIPAVGSINMEGLPGDIDMEQIMSVPHDFWLDEYRACKKFFQEQLPMDTPIEMENELFALKSRITNIPARVCGVRYIHSHPCTVAKGELEDLPPKVRQFVLDTMEMCSPASVYICDGSYEERLELLESCEAQGSLIKLPKYRNCYLARTDPADVFRMHNEERTVVVASREEDAVPPAAPGVNSTLGNWMSPDEYTEVYEDRFRNAMTGRMMYVVPFSMGPVGSTMARYAVQCTDSPYVAALINNMARVGNKALTALGQKNFIRCLHSVGGPLNVPNRHNREWPCDPERVIIAHLPESWEVHSYGSAYGGNSLSSKRSISLRLGTAIGSAQGFLAEHVMIIGVTSPAGKKRYMALCFSVGCGRLHLAMMESALPGYKITCLNDDTAWMRFDNQGKLRAINPEAGFFGLISGTNYRNNPKCMKMIYENTIFTNAAETSDGGVYWDGLEDPPSGVTITDWRGKKWSRSHGTRAAHPSARFCAPVSQCPAIDPDWDTPEGVVIDAIVFGVRRTDNGGIPLVTEATDWNQGVFMGAAMRSHDMDTNDIFHDPFAMRAYFGINFGTYLRHWLSFGLRKGLTLPKFYQVNWFRTNNNGRLLWPGFSENARVLDWIFRRLDGEQSIELNKLGLGVPSRENGLRTDGLREFDYDALFGLDKHFWDRELAAIRKFFDDNLPIDLPSAVLSKLNEMQMKFAL